jgi:hypothetical protein
MSDVAKKMQRETYAHLFHLSLVGLMAKGLIYRDAEPSTWQLALLEKRNITMRDVAEFFHELGLDLQFSIIHLPDGDETT